MADEDTAKDSRIRITIEGSEESATLYVNALSDDEWALLTAMKNACAKVSDLAPSITVHRQVPVTRYMWTEVNE